MTIIRGCDLPQELYYLIDKHVWARPVEGGLVQVGMTLVAGKLAGGKLNAITVKTKNIGQEIKQGKSIATVESSKFVGPVPAPVSGILLGQRKTGSRSQLGRFGPLRRRLDRRDQSSHGRAKSRPGDRRVRTGRLSGQAGSGQYLLRLIRRVRQRKGHDGKDDL